MKPLSDISRVYLIGIGGIGMSALAKFFRHHGMQVGGYDRTETEMTHTLAQSGMSITYSNAVEAIPKDFLLESGTLIIYTPAVPNAHPQKMFFEEQGFEVMKRAAVLGELSHSYRTLAVAGTHGKTTTSSMLAHILHHSTLGCNAFLGGISTDHDTNLLLSEKSDLLVVEADEYDRSFLHLAPSLSIITSVDADHLDIYGTHDDMLHSFGEFVQRTDRNGTVIHHEALPIAIEHPNAVSYALNTEADYSATDLRVENGRYHFDIMTPEGKWSDMELGMPGRHNVENAVAAMAAANILGVRTESIREAMKSYRGVKRRFEIHVNRSDKAYVDDYAHHPTELNACIASARELFPGRAITGIFQPHLYTRTRDHLEAFGKSLSALDALILLDVYPAREEPIAGVTSEALLEKVALPRKQLSDMQTALETACGPQTDVLLTMGAGDIDRMVQPLRKRLNA